MNRTGIIRRWRSHLVTAVVAASLGALVGGPVSLSGATTTATTATQADFDKHRFFSLTVIERDWSIDCRIRLELGKGKDATNQPTGFLTVTVYPVTPSDPHAYACGDITVTTDLQWRTQVGNEFVHSEDNENGSWLRSDVRPVRLVRQAGVSTSNEQGPTDPASFVIHGPAPT